MPLQLTIATVAGVAAGIWSWLLERKKIRAARAEGYGAGWDACEAHRRAHQALCPDADPDEMFDAGYKCGLEVAVIRHPQSDDWKRGFEFGFELAGECPRCTPKSERAVN